MRIDLWFAWFPVQIESGGWAFLRRVWRETRWYSGEPFWRYFNERPEQ